MTYQIRQQFLGFHIALWKLHTQIVVTQFPNPGMRILRKIAHLSFSQLSYLVMPSLDAYGVISGCYSSNICISPFICANAERGCFVFCAKPDGRVVEAEQAAAKAAGDQITTLERGNSLVVEDPDTIPPGNDVTGRSDLWDLEVTILCVKSSA